MPIFRTAKRGRSVECRVGLLWLTCTAPYPTRCPTRTQTTTPLWRLEYIILHPSSTLACSQPPEQNSEQSHTLHELLGTLPVVPNMCVWMVNSSPHGGDHIHTFSAHPTPSLANSPSSLLRFGSADWGMGNPHPIPNPVPFLGLTTMWTAFSGPAPHRHVVSPACGLVHHPPSHSLPQTHTRFRDGRQG